MFFFLGRRGWTHLLTVYVHDSINSIVFFLFSWYMPSQNLQNAANPLPSEVTGDGSETHSRSHLSWMVCFKNETGEKESLTSDSFLSICFALHTHTYSSQMGLLKLHNRCTTRQNHLTWHYGKLAAGLLLTNGGKKGRKKITYWGSVFFCCWQWEL